MKAVAYIRVSTEEQDISPAVQADRIKAYCIAKGLELTEIFQDIGVSGGKPISDRQGGRSLLNALKGKRAPKVIIVLKLDRAFRSATDALQTVENWDKKDISLHIVDLDGSSIDTRTAAGKFLLTVLAAAAEMERNMTRERTKAAMGQLRAEGRRISHRIPFGFNLAPDGKHLVSNPDEQTAICLMCDLRAEGLTLQAICCELERRGISTKQGGIWKPNIVFTILKRIQKRAA